MTCKVIDFFLQYYPRVTLSSWMQSCVKCIVLHLYISLLLFLKTQWLNITDFSVLFICMLPNFLFLQFILYLEYFKWNFIFTYELWVIKVTYISLLRFDLDCTESLENLGSTNNCIIWIFHSKKADCFAYYDLVFCILKYFINNKFY